MTEPSPTADPESVDQASEPVLEANDGSGAAAPDSGGVWPPSHRRIGAGASSGAATEAAATSAPPTDAVAGVDAPPADAATPADAAIPADAASPSDLTTDEPDFDARTAVPVGPGRVDGKPVAAGAPPSPPEPAPSVRRADEPAPPAVRAPEAPRARPEGPSRPPAIFMEAATRRFRDVVAVDELSLVVEPGTILGLIGPSGAGKTTAIRLLTGSLKPDRGRVRVLGEDPRKFRRRTRERIGYMPQQFLLYPDLTADENVDFVASLFGMLFWRRRRRVRKVLELVGLLDVRDRRASRLSGGMQRRLALACALVHDPALLFLDEPTAGIDPILRKSIWTELHRLRDLGRTLLVTTQYVNEAEECDAVALIAHGRLVAVAPPEDLRRQALGGEVIDVETTRTWDDGDLRGIPLVRAARQIGPRRLLVVTEDAGAATPAVVEAVRSKGGDVASVREYSPSFDEVFAELVGRTEDDQSRDESDSRTITVVSGRRNGS